jgi:hypothetical protein
MVQQLEEEVHPEKEAPKEEVQAQAEPSIEPKCSSEPKHEATNGASAPVADNLPKNHHYRSTNFW